MAEKAIIVNTPKNKIQSDAQDWASIFNSIIGDQSGVLTYGEELNLINKNDNTVTLHDGVYSMQGHMIQVERGSTVDITVDSGTLGIERVDSVVVEYVKNGDRTENDTFEFKIIKGEPQPTGGNAVAPTLLQEDLLGGGLKRQERLFDLEIKGTTMTVVEKREYVNSMKEQADRIASEFGNINSMFHKITDTTPAVGGWEGAKYILVPPHFSGKFEVLDAKVKNSNTVWLDANAFVRPHTARTRVGIEVPAGYVNLEIRIIIMKI